MHRKLRTALCVRVIAADQQRVADWHCGYLIETLLIIWCRYVRALKYEIIYRLHAVEYLFVFFQLDMFRAYTPIFRSNGCYNFFTYAAYGVL